MHNGTSLSQAYTLNTTSAQTIGGIASGSYILQTNNEVISVISDGSNWQILEHRTNSIWTSYTPTFVGFGSVTTNINVFWKRSGSEMLLRGSWLNGTTGASTASITLPAGPTINSTFVPVLSQVGYALSSDQGSQSKIILGNGGATTLNFAVFNLASHNTNTTQIGSDVAAAGSTMNINAIIPITAWQP